MHSLSQAILLRDSDGLLSWTGLRPVVGGRRRRQQAWLRDIGARSGMWRSVLPVQGGRQHPRKLHGRWGHVHDQHYLWARGREHRLAANEHLCQHDGMPWCAYTLPCSRFSENADLSWAGALQTSSRSARTGSTSSSAASTRPTSGGSARCPACLRVSLQTMSASWTSAMAVSCRPHLLPAACCVPCCVSVAAY